MPPARLITALLFSALLGSRYFPEAANAATPAARIGDEIISLEEIQEALQNELRNVERERFRLIDAKLAQVIADKLVAAEAKRRGIAVAELVKQEIDAKAAPVSDGEVDRFIAENRPRLASGEEAGLKAKVSSYLREQKIAERRSEYIRSLRAEAAVKVFLVDPTAVKVDASKGFARGAETAAVKIVEFSDFRVHSAKPRRPQSKI